MQDVQRARFESRDSRTEYGVNSLTSTSRYSLTEWLDWFKIMVVKADFNPISTQTNHSCCTRWLINFNCSGKKYVYFVNCMYSCCVSILKIAIPLLIKTKFQRRVSVKQRITSSLGGNGLSSTWRRLCNAIMSCSGFFHSLKLSFNLLSISINYK